MMLSFKQLNEKKKKTNIKINPKKDELMEKKHGADCTCKVCEDKQQKDDPDVAKNTTESISQEDTAYEGQEEVSEKINQESMYSNFPTFDSYINERTRYAKETGKNLKSGKDSKKGGRGPTKDKALAAVLADITKKHGKGAVMGQTSRQEKKTKGQKSTVGTGKYLKKAKAKKEYADRARKAGYKNPQDYANVVARYGSEDNYKKGKGLGS